MNKLWLIIVAILILCISTVWYVFDSNEDNWTTIEQELGADPKLFSDPFLMLQSYLETQDYKVERSRKMPVLVDVSESNVAAKSAYVDPNDSTLLLFNAYNLLDNQNSQNLKNWIYQGGNAVVSVEDAQGLITEWESSSLLKDFDIYLESNLKQHHEDNTLDLSEYFDLLIDDYSNCRAEEAQIGTVASEEIKHSMDARLYFWHDEDNAYVSGALKDETLGYPLFLQIDYGQGRLNIINNSQLWNNQNLRCHDNAWFLQALLPFAKEAPNVEIVWYRHSPSLWTLIWRYFPWLVVVLAIALILFIWRAVTTFGMKRDLEHSHRRSLHEHLLAAGKFQWAQKNPVLVSQLQAEVNRLAHRKIIGFAGSELFEGWQLLARYCQLPDTDSALAMRDLSDVIKDKKWQDDDIIEQIKLLQSMLMVLQSKTN